MANPVIIGDALHTAGAVVSAEEARLSQAAAWARSTTGVGARTGVVYAGVLALVQPTATTAPSMTVTVAPFHFVAQKAAAEGVYVGSSPATVTVDVAAAPGSNSRIDVVYVMQRDSGSTTAPDGTIQGEVGVVTGTAAVTPAKPAIPAGAVEVGTVTVAAGATATTGAQVTVATTCLWTAPLGSPVPVRSAAERDALTQYGGLRALRLDVNYIEHSDGYAWKPAVETFLGTESYALGSPPPAGTRVITRRGSYVGPVTGASGGIGFSWESPFPNGIVTFFVAPGDNAGGLAYLIPVLGNCSLSVWGGAAFQAGGVAVPTNTNIRVNYLALGW